MLPSDLPEALEGGNEEEFLGADKAATPADRARSAKDLEKNMARARPQILLPQRDSDAKKNVQESRVNALEQYSTLHFWYEFVTRRAGET